MKLLFIFLIFSLNGQPSIGQQTKSTWTGYKVKKSDFDFLRFNSYLGVPDIRKSNKDLEIRLYLTTTSEIAMIKLSLKKDSLSAIYFSRHTRTMDDPLDTTFPKNEKEIIQDNMDSLFMALLGHNVMTLPDQSNTYRPNYFRAYTIQFKSNNKIRSYSFEDPWFVDKDSPKSLKNTNPLLACLEN